MENLVEKAIEVAAKAHASQRRKLSGEPYIFHPLRVAMQMNTDKLRAAAVLHDVLEDGEMAVKDLVDQGIPWTVVNIVTVLTRRCGQTYMDYIKSIARCPVNIQCIKIADIRDNLRDLPEGDSLRDRYHKALAILEPNKQHQTQPAISVKYWWQ